MIKFSFAHNDIKFEHIGLNEGLSQTSIFCILKDKQGFLWFGTEDGLNKFDGYKFTIYRPDLEKKTSLSNSYISSIYENKDGLLLIGTLGGGLNIFNPRTESFSHYKNKTDDLQSLSNNFIYAIYEDSRGNLWIGTNGGGLNKFNFDKKNFLVYKENTNNPKSISNNIVRVIYEDSRGNLWIGTNGGGLNIFDYKTETFCPYKNIPNDSKSLSNDIVMSIYEDSDKTLWIGTDGGGLNKFDYGSKSFKNYQNQVDNPNSISSNHISVIFEDRDKDLWIGTNGGGLNKFDSKKELFFRHINQIGVTTSISHNLIRTIFEDPNGRLWIGTNGGGLNIFDKNKKVFKHYKNNPNNPNSLRSNRVFSIFEDNQGVLWIGTFGGLNKYNKKTKTVTHFRNQPNVPNSLSHNYIRTIIEDKNGILWVGTQGGGLNKFDQQNKVFTHYKHQKNNPNSICSDSIYVLYIDKNEIMWIGTAGSGLDKFNLKTEVFTHYSNQYNNLNSISNNFVKSIYEDSDGILWLGTIGGGLNKFDKKTASFSHFKNSLENRGSISSNSIYSVYIDSNGVIWIGTAGGGLNKFDKETESFIHYKKKDGLPNNVIYGILEDENKYLWLSTNNGISRFDPKTERFTNYDKMDGLQDNEFNGGAYHKNRDGLMYFGGVNGFNEFYPKRVKDNRFIPPVVITDFLLFNKSVNVGDPQSDNFLLKESINFTKEIVLDYTDYIFSFEFSALNFRQSVKNKYRYMMEGLDKNWIETDYKNRRATYTDLSHGEYRFIVKGSNDDGYWNEKGASVKIIILPPPWKTWWAYTIYLSILILLVFLFVTSQRKKLILKQKELDLEKKFTNRLEKKVEERTAEIVFQKEKLEAQAKKLMVINKELEKLSIIVRETDNAVFVMDIEGKIEWVNEGFIRLYENTMEKFIDEMGGDIFEFSANKNILNDFNSCISTKKSVTYESLYKTRTGKTFWVQTTLTPILGQSGDVEKIIAIDSDISKIKEAEKKAETASQFKSEFLARMSHEIRTPMNGVIGFAEMIMETNLNSEQLEYAKTITRSGEALIVILNDILDFSKIEAGELTFDSIDFDPEITLFDCCDLMASRINTKPVELLCRIGDNVPGFIKTDPGRFRQVIINLLGNAVKFTDSGEIEISLEVEEENRDSIKFHIKVRDTGIGISEDKIESIFEVFTQADGATTRKYGGTGLGLSICKQIAKYMKGDVWVESILGEGSTFHFTCQVEKSYKKSDMKIEYDILQNKRALIVDDNQTNIEILSHILELCKMKVDKVTDSKKVVSKIDELFRQKKGVDICILDIQMPQISGFDLALKIKELEKEFSYIPILAFSSSTWSRKKKFKEMGFDGFLPKPINRRKLIRVLERLLNKRKDKQKKPDNEFITQHSIIEDVKHSLNILLAEDNPINQKLAKYILEKSGYKLYIVNNGKEAIDLFIQDPSKYDLILMDIQMPVIDGKEAAKIIRGKGFEEIPIIAMTAEAMKGDREKCIEAGMNDYITKPIKRDKIFKMIKKWCLN